MDANKLIDITNKEQIKHLNFDKLIDDAIERGDTEAITWLSEKNRETQVRTSKKGKKYTVGASFLLVRNEYLAKFRGWVPECETAEPKKTFPEKQAERANKLSAALVKAVADKNKK